MENYTLWTRRKGVYKGLVTLTSILLILSQSAELIFCNRILDNDSTTKIINFIAAYLLFCQILIISKQLFPPP